MIYHASPLAVAIFIFFVGIVLGLSFYLGRKAKSSSGYFAAHGQIPWFINGVAFAGDYLSAASFLGICGMIAFYGYDGFLYSIGYLAGWVVALFVIAEPIKRLGKFTFADALDAKFNSPGIKLTAAISTLIVSIFYLIPQMVGAGALVKPLLGLPHWAGVAIVGVVVIVIVTTAGMVSTTWVQFIKGSLLVVFCTVLVGLVLHRGITRHQVPYDGELFKKIGGGHETMIVSPVSREKPRGGLVDESPESSEGPQSPFKFIRNLGETGIVFWKSKRESDGSWVGTETDGDQLLVAGGSPTFKGVRSPKLFDKLDFISLMLALFCGTASLPHILIRYYTVKDGAAARKSTVVGIATIGFFYILTLFIGLGAMVSGALDPTDSNMAAPLLARTFGELPFAIISAIAFTTVLGTVSGLILAASGAVAHDILKNFLKWEMTDRQQINYAKITAVVVGIIAMFLGVVFQHLNVGFLVGWAFNVAASANLPSLVMLLFWKRTTKQGITASISVGLLTSLAWLLVSAPAYKDVYHIDPARAIAPFSQPGLVTIPLSFLVLVIVSLLTRREEDVRGFEVVQPSAR